MKHLKRLLVLAVGLLLMVSCSSVNKSEVSFSLQDLVSDKGTFSWADTEFGSSISQVENGLDITFPDIPFNCDEWYEGNGKPTTAELYDYKNKDDYYYVEYAAYKDQAPLIINYKNYVGNLTFEFHAGGLRVVYIYFTNGPMQHDSKMNSNNHENNVDELFEQLNEDARETFGEPNLENELFHNPCYCWEKNGTRLYIAKNDVESTEFTMIAIQKLLKDQ